MLNQTFNKMRNLEFLTLIFTVALFFSSCEKNKNELPVKFEFNLLDTMGIEKIEFNHGENIIFSFQMINHSSEDLVLENFFPNNEFFRVYQTDTQEGILDWGIPYDGYYKISGFKMSSNDTLRIEYPWESKTGIINENYWIVFGDKTNPALQRGDYTTYFSQSFKIDDIKMEEQHFKINFTVK